MNDARTLAAFRCCPTDSWGPRPRSAESDELSADDDSGGDGGRPPTPASPAIGARPKVAEAPGERQG